MHDRDLFEHGQRIAQLERKLSELYRRLGQEEPDFSQESGDVQDPRVIELIQGGREIEAIKLYRELTGLGLKEAKDAVDRMRGMYKPTG